MENPSKMQHSTLLCKTHMSYPHVVTSSLTRVPFAPEKQLDQSRAIFNTRTLFHVVVLHNVVNKKRNNNMCVYGGNMLMWIALLVEPHQ